MYSMIIPFLAILIALTAGTMSPAEAAAKKAFDDLTLLELVICRDVVEREPVEVRQSYSMDDERAWGYARINNSGDMRTVTFIWYHEDEIYYEVDTRVGTSPNWRTYSSVVLQPGVWRLELHNDDGDKLNEVRFHVSE